MKLYSLLGVLSASFAVGVRSDTCGVPSVRPVVSNLNVDEESRIRGGEEAVPHSWPWQVRLGAQLFFGAATVFCGGSILDDQHILTAAHCFTPNFGPNPRFFVRVGDHSMLVNEPSQRDILVDRVIDHPNFTITANGVLNDISILRLKTKLPLSDKIKPICLPSPGSDALPGAKCVVTGWGSTVNQTSGLKMHPLLQLRQPRNPIVKPSNVLKQAVAPIFNRDQCRLLWGPMLQDHMICTWDTNDGDEPCQGDSGGPLNCLQEDGSWSVSGVVSFGGGCGVFAPAVFTRVGEFIPWIKQTIESG